MKKIISILVAVTLLAALFVGCGVRGNNTPSNQSANVPDTSAQVASPTEAQPGFTLEVPTVPALPTAPDIPTRVTKEEEVAINFVDALLHENYTEALELLSSFVYPNALVFTEDLKWALPRTDFRVLEYIDAESVQYQTSLDANGTVTVRLNDAQGGNETVKVRIEIPKDGDGTPKVNGNGEFYRVKYGFRTPSNVQVEIGGIPVDKSYITKKNSGKISMYTDWTVPVIGVQDKEVRIYCDNFDTTKTITPKSFSDQQNDEDCRVFPIYEDEDILMTVKNLWNDMYTAATVKDAKASDLYPFIAADADPDVAQNILDGCRSLDAEADQNLKMTQAVFRTDGSSFWADDHHLVVNFGYELTWDYHGGKSMKRLSSIILAKEADGWKVYRVTDSELFTWLNYFTSQW